MKGERNSLSKDDQIAFSKAIREKLFELEFYKKCNVLFTYVSFQSEVDTLTIINQALEDKKKVFAPRVEGNEVVCKGSHLLKNMDFYEIYSTKAFLQSNYGIWEPKKEEERRYTGSQEIKLILLPGLAFDLSGNRIGYGAGYYDRYLNTHSNDNFLKIALAYDFQIVGPLKADAYDVRTDLILTPSRIIHCR
jgi:5-formyltetrahydrofolate cyclo-ligase